MLLPSGNPCKCHEEVLYLQPMIQPIFFTFPPPTGACSEGLAAFRFFFKTSAIDLPNANPACRHKEVPRSTCHIMVTTRYSDQQGSKMRQKIMRLHKQWHRPISKRFIKPPHSISRATSIDSNFKEKSERI